MERNLIELNPRKERMGETPHKCLPLQPHEKCIPAVGRGKTKAAELVKMLNYMLAGVRGTTPQPPDKQNFLWREGSSPLNTGDGEGWSRNRLTSLGSHALHVTSL